MTTNRGRAGAGGARSRNLALSLALIAAVALMLGALVEALPKGVGNAGYVGLATVLVISTVGVGSVLVSRLPRHIIGWLLLLGGLSIAVSTAGQALADYGLNEHPGSVPGAVGLAILTSATSGIFVSLLGGFVPLYFPTGQLPSPRWRPVLLIAVVSTVTLVITSVLGPFPDGDYPPGVVNPLALDGVGGQLVAALSAIANVLGVVALVCVIASLAVRYRRSQGVERAQLKWFAYVGLIVVPTLLLGIVAGTLPPGPLASIVEIAWIGAIGGLVMLPVAIGIAVLRYRLYEIDRLVSRTISWAVVTAILGTCFVAIILVSQALLAPVTGSNVLAVAGSTLLVAALFQPIRRRVQQVVDRRFNRARFDADQTVAAFAARLRDQVDLEQLRAEILATVGQTVEPSSASLWLRE
jgi:hypothetical protein